ncbi:hypothetical protein [Pseudoalteromonas aliena]|uniref:Uncharacterized protein n=1 Tax=Pseudoalteromonas aliena SW19 TaxID=1314866 RepID=A0ABR9E413_9GAMM|nr:hypothetical protein [Pseudoalteromonas aliena]MBE0360581.1 hypothetical protein [Pseudoalteromonas aliena SW19]
MRGMYINCDKERLPSSLYLTKNNSRIFDFPQACRVSGCIVYDEENWSQLPYEQIEHNIFIMSGWFIYKEQLNPLTLLANDIVAQGIDALNNVLTGVFTLFWQNEHEEFVFTDPLGLSTHFIDKLSTQLRVAPSVKVLKNDSHHLNHDMQCILNKKNHLFGNYTLFDGLQRLTPGSCVGVMNERSYFVFHEAKPLDSLADAVKKLTSLWQEHSKILPISSGLDSRYLLANGTYKYGFTYGPDNSPEREIAASFSEDFKTYLAFDYSEQPLHEQEQAILDEMAFGTLNPIPRLLTNYSFVAQHFEQAKIFFDGYLGDLFQRGTYINFKGKRGEVLKLFPFIYSVINFKAKTLMRLRYKELTDKEFTILWQDFVQRTDSLALTDYQKVTYYEFLYGRGGRYTIFGSNILAAQFFTVVSPFSARGIFDSFIQQDYAKAVRYRALKKIWSKVAVKYKKIKVESGYTPLSNPVTIPSIQLIYRLMFHFIPSRANYGVKSKRMENNKK